MDVDHRSGGEVQLAIERTRAIIDEAMRHAVRIQPTYLGYAAELQRWTQRAADSCDGIPITCLDSSGRADGCSRWLPDGTLRQLRGWQRRADASALPVLTSAGDDRVSVVRASEALVAGCCSAQPSWASTRTR